METPFAASLGYEWLSRQRQRMASLPSGGGAGSAVSRYAGKAARWGFVIRFGNENGRLERPFDASHVEGCNCCGAATE